VHLNRVALHPRRPHCVPSVCRVCRVSAPPPAWQRLMVCCALRTRAHVVLVEGEPAVQRDLPHLLVEEIASCACAVVRRVRVRVRCLAQPR
jgi:hypothetical protein